MAPYDMTAAFGTSGSYFIYLAIGFDWWDRTTFEVLTTISGEIEQTVDCKGN